ncbi:ribonuclease Y [Patescibacteria group bacterium]|nr:ribonuclease Y [Patescibacteria group bacterium]
MEIIYIVLIVTAFLGISGGYVFYSKRKDSPQENNKESPKPAEQEKKSPAVQIDVDKESVVIEARSKAKDIVFEAKESALDIQSKAQDQARKIKEEALEAERKAALFKAQVDAKAKELESKAKSLVSIKENLEKKQEEIENFHKKQQEEIEKIASMSKEEAREIILKNLDKNLVEEKGKRIREKEEEIRKESEEMAKQILMEALEFGSTDIVIEHSTSKVKLPDEELKGRIIGKEGRNIRTFEELTGADLDLDSSPGDIIVSCFDSVRRAVATAALERLVADGRIQPARIEEIVDQTKKEMDSIMYKAGDSLCHKLGLYNIPRELIQILGRFKYRFSYGQNMLEHTMETARIGVYIAEEIGADIETVKLGCVFHDIGKVLTDQDGSHVELGVELLRKYKIPEEAIKCVGEHHDDRQSTIESAIVTLADHVSGARPGSRGEDYESYVKRLKDLEEAAMSFDGVEKAYAVSAGREVRVFVKPEKVDDYSTALLAKDIARKIELEQNYPGVVKVIVIRETRVSETAK